MRIGQAEAAALVEAGQAFVVNGQQARLVEVCLLLALTLSLSPRRGEQSRTVS